jgi:hypothetical protein
MDQFGWYKFEKKLHLCVQEQKLLNTNVLDSRLRNGDVMAVHSLGPAWTKIIMQMQ